MRVWLIYTKVPTLRPLGFAASPEQAEDFIARRLGEAHAATESHGGEERASVMWYTNAKVVAINLED